MGRNHRHVFTIYIKIYIKKIHIYISGRNEMKPANPSGFNKGVFGNVRIAVNANNW